ncbi:MAG TPA: pyrrolo-quinoline quinone, partial [Planctomycetota bacterium]|nr:pyrrolo-quinoline quinone [Planctomycetota bacterium]
GIVYNQHHGHGHVARFAGLMGLMKPYLIALNLNGMFPDGDKAGKKITPIGQGPLDADLLRIIRASGWHGPIGLLNHTDEDAEARLRDNQDGLNWLLAQIDGKVSIPKPVPRSWKP